MAALWVVLEPVEVTGFELDYNRHELGPMFCQSALRPFIKTVYLKNFQYR